jgi:hypothetical protein
LIKQRWIRVHELSHSSASVFFQSVTHANERADFSIAKLRKSKHQIIFGDFAFLKRKARSSDMLKKPVHHNKASLPKN